MRLASNLSTSDDLYKSNYTQSEKLISELLEQHRATTAPTKNSAIEKHTSRGKLLVRDRIAKLIDFGSPFLELSTLAGLGLYDGVQAGAGIVTGIARIQNRECMVVANDATVKGGTYFPMTVKKHLRAQEIALENNLPCIYLVDSGGAFLPLQDQVFPDRDHFGRIFYNQARMSALGIPQIAVVMGSCTAGGAYVPAMCDEAIIVREQGTVFLGGPPLVKAATGEEITAEALGGAEVHCSISGVTDHFADDDLQALTQARTIFKNLGPYSLTKAQHTTPLAPEYDPDEILGLISQDSKKQFPIRELLTRMVDESEFDEFKQRYGTSLLCGFSRIHGYTVGIIANDGILFSESAVKAAHFIELCEYRRIPLVFLQNIVGFMVGKNYEHGGIAKHGAKMVTAVSSCSVPKFTVIIGGSFGAGNYGMAGRAYQPRFLFMWPNAKISVMGPEQAASVLTQVKRESSSGKGKTTSEQDLAEYHAQILASYTSQASAYYSTARLWDDGIIDPRETRNVLGLSIAASTNQDWAAPIRRDAGLSGFGIFRM